MAKRKTTMSSYPEKPNTPWFEELSPVCIAAILSTAAKNLRSITKKIPMLDFIELCKHVNYFCDTGPYSEAYYDHELYIFSYKCKFRLIDGCLSNEIVDVKVKKQVRYRKALPAAA
jgi:hypothetical protein